MEVFNCGCGGSVAVSHRTSPSARGRTCIFHACACAAVRLRSGVMAVRLFVTELAGFRGDTTPFGGGGGSGGTGSSG